MLIGLQKFFSIFRDEDFPIGVFVFICFIPIIGTILLIVFWLIALLFSGEVYLWKDFCKKYFRYKPKNKKEQ
jgi:hypothetical protein